MNPVSSAHVMRRTRTLSTSLLLVLPMLLGACGYNSIQSYDEAAAQAKQNIDAQLQRRADLIGNLVATVKGFAQQESDVLIGVANARAGLTGALQKAGGSDPAELANANQALTSALGRMNVVIEAYPQLKSDQGFLKLQDELTGTENRIAVARNRYIQAVQEYNVLARSFPTNLTAMVFGYKPKENFSVANEAAISTAPRVDFGGTPAAPAASR